MYNEPDFKSNFRARLTLDFVKSIKFYIILAMFYYLFFIATLFIGGYLSSGIDYYVLLLNPGMLTMLLGLVMPSILWCVWLVEYYKTITIIEDTIRYDGFKKIYIPKTILSVFLVFHKYILLFCLLSISISVANIFIFEFSDKSISILGFDIVYIDIVTLSVFIGAWLLVKTAFIMIDINDILGVHND